MPFSLQPQVLDEDLHAVRSRHESPINLVVSDGAQVRDATEGRLISV